MPRTLAELAVEGRIDAGWAEALAPVQGVISDIGERLRAEQAAGRGYLPAGDDVLRAFQRPLSDVRVLITGQDPYPTPGHPIGLSFAVERHVRPLPRSLGNIYKERATDLGIPPAPHGDLTAWSDQGVLLLNRVLTVQPGTPASHRGWGWEQVTELAIRALVAREQPLVAILWGKDAANLQPLLGDDPGDRFRTPVAAVGEPRVLRLAAVLPHERPSGGIRSSSGGLAGRGRAGRVRRLSACSSNPATAAAAFPATCGAPSRHPTCSPTRSGRRRRPIFRTSARSTTTS